MKEKFEHKLVNKIRDTFDSHEAVYNPQDWELMKDKLPEKRSALTLLWVMARVAVILLLVALGSYFLFDALIDKDSQIVNIKAVVETVPENKGNMDRVQNQINDSNIYSVDKNFFDDSEIEKVQNKNDKLKDEKSQIPSINVADLNVTAEKQTSNPNENDESKVDSDIISLPVFDKIVAESNCPNVDSLIQSNALPNQPAVAQLEPTPDIYENEKTKKQRVRLGAEFVSFTNYSPENITPGLNYGGGVTADIPIKKRFSFAPGLLVSVYNVEFGGNPNSYDAAQPGSYSVNSLHSNNDEVKPSKMQLTSLDIPINFQYQFWQRKTSDYFVELGFSSLVYLSEDFEYTFVSTTGGPFPNDTEMSGDNTASGEVNVDAFNTFDFARLINFSVGMDYRLNKRLDFTINPYIKYPVSTLTSGDIKFGSGGLKLKFMLKPGK
ncbi:MAG: porin family protein [Bacteroidales bacterium]